MGSGLSTPVNHNSILCRQECRFDVMCARVRRGLARIQRTTWRWSTRRRLETVAEFDWPDRRPLQAERYFFATDSTRRSDVDYTSE